MNLGAPELLILLTGLVPTAIAIWGIADAASRPEWAWQMSGQNKMLWVVLQVVGIFFCLGWLLALIYLITIRPQVAQHQGRFPSPPPPAGPPSSWGGPPSR